MTLDVADHLGSFPSFANLSQGDLAALGGALVVKSLAAGEALIEEGARGDAVYLILQGEVLVGRQRGATWDEVNRLHPGDFVGLLALIDSEPRSATCRAAGPVVVGALPRSAFTVLVRAHAPVAHAFQRALACQLTRDFRNLEAQIREALEATGR
jgi:putative ABC transport system ATP-binding protein